MSKGIFAQFQWLRVVTVIMFVGFVTQLRWLKLMLHSDHFLNFSYTVDMSKKNFNTVTMKEDSVTQ